MAATVAAQLAALIEVVNSLKERADEDRDDLKHYHEKLSKDLDADRRSADAYRATVQEDLSKLTQGQLGLLDRIDAIEPVTSMVTSMRAKIAGAMIVLGFIGSIAIWAATYFKAEIMKLFTG